MGMYNLASLSNFLARARQRYESQDDVAQGAGNALIQDSRLDGERVTDNRGAFSTSPLSASWDKLDEISREDQTTTGIVTGWNRGGLLVRWDDLQGFVPASQLKEVPLFHDDDSRDEKLSRWVGEELNLKVIELDPGRNRLVFSERATIWGPKDGERLLAEIRPGDVHEGYVSNLCDFGAFVDLGGIDGLIHISELSWGRVAHPANLLQIGQRVRVCVLSVDRAGRHVGLSVKRLLPNPWSVVEERYAPNEIVRATITNLVDFGAFAQIEEGLEGLIHISELTDAHIQHPSEVVKPGDCVSVRVLRVDASRHRLSLSMKAIPPEAPHAPLHQENRSGQSSVSSL